MTKASKKFTKIKDEIKARQSKIKKQASKIKKLKKEEEVLGQDLRQGIIRPYVDW